MPPLPKFFRDLLAGNPLPLAGADVGARFLDRPVRQLKLIAQQAPDLLGEGMGTLIVGEGLVRAALPAPITPDRLKADHGFARVLGGAELEPGAADGSTIRLVQRALQAIAARVEGADPLLRLPGWGADGDYGNETRRAVEAFQRSAGLTADGATGKEVAQALLDALGATQAPNLWAELPQVARVAPGARLLAEIAQGLTESTKASPYTRRVGGTTYSYFAEMFGTTPEEKGMIRAPGGVSYGLRVGQRLWKCNVFAGTVIALAGLPVPSFSINDAGVRHFPRAEKFGDALAAKRGWTMISYLNHADPEDPHSSLTGTAQDAEIAELLHQVQPGDLLFVDHEGVPGRDGGHCRVAVAAAEPDDHDIAPAFAQARSDTAEVERNGMRQFTQLRRELQYWLVRYTG